MYAKFQVPINACGGAVGLTGSDIYIRETHSQRNQLRNTEVRFPMTLPILWVMSQVSQSVLDGSLHLLMPGKCL